MADIGVHKAKGWEEGAVIRLLVEGQGNRVTELLFVAGTLSSGSVVPSPSTVKKLMIP